jgi:predicted RNase H-like HicB family nuclease
LHEVGKVVAQRIEVRIEIFQEGDLYVGLCPALDVSSFGETPEAAKQSVQEALEAFFEECEAMGTLAEVLQEAGFIQKDR